MKLFLALFSLTFLTVQASPEGCQFCVQGIMKVFNYGATDSGIQESILFLQDVICPSEVDIEGCKTGIATWWGPISQHIYVEKAQCLKIIKKSHSTLQAMRATFTF